MEDLQCMTEDQIQETLYCRLMFMSAYIVSFLGGQSELPDIDMAIGAVSQRSGKIPKSDAKT